MSSSNESEQFDFQKRFFTLMETIREQVLADVNRALDVHSNLFYDLFLQGMKEQKDMVFRQFDEILGDQMEVLGTSLHSSLAARIQTSSTLQPKVPPFKQSLPKTLKRPNEFAQPSTSKQICSTRPSATVESPFINPQPSTSKQAFYQIPKVQNTNSSTQTNTIIKTHSNRTAGIQQVSPKVPSITTPIEKTLANVRPIGNPNQIIYVKKSSLPASFQTSIASQPTIAASKTSSITTQSSKLPATNTQSNNILTKPTISKLPQQTQSAKNTGPEIIVISMPVENQGPPPKEYTPTFVKYADKVTVPKHLEVDTSCSCNDCFKHENPGEFENGQSNDESDDEVCFVNERKRVPQPAYKRAPRRRGIVTEFVCKYENCGRIYNSLVHLTRHEMSHNIIFQCIFPDCTGFSNSERNKVAKHVRQFHFGQQGKLKEQAQQGIPDAYSFVEEMLKNEKEPPIEILGEMSPHM